MAILFSYPTVTPKLQDLLIGTEMAIQGGQDTPRTRTFTVGSLISLVQTGIVPTLQQVITAGNTTNKSVLITLSSGTLPALVANTIDVTSITGRSVNQVGVFGSSDNGIGGRFSTGTISISSTANIVEFLKADQVQAYVTHDGKSVATQFRLSALNTAPATATSTGTLGEIRIATTHIYICIATNTWVRAALTTF